MNPRDYKKSKQGNFRNAPWLMPKTQLEGFTLITEANKQEARVIGRVLYNIEFSIYGGFFEIMPRLKKGRLSMTNHPFFPDFSIWITADESMEDYKHRFKPVTHLLERGVLYYKIEDKIVKYGK